MIINNYGYVCPRGKLNKTVFLVKYGSNIHRNKGEMQINKLVLPKHFVGKRIRIKIEVVSDKE